MVSLGALLVARWTCTAAFLDAEASRYHPQLARYARIVGALDPRPVRIALYHPLVPGGFRELPPGGQR